MDIRYATLTETEKNKVFSPSFEKDVIFMPEDTDVLNEYLDCLCGVKKRLVEHETV